MTKQQILERYLNVAYFGHRAYGIYAAAEVYFSKTPGGSHPRRGGDAGRAGEGALGVRPGARPRPAATERRNYVIDRMTDDSGTCRPTRRRRRRRRSRIALRLTDPPNDCVSVTAGPQRLGLLLRRVQEVVVRQPAFGANPAGPGGEPAPRRLPDRHLARPEDPGHRRWARAGQGAGSRSKYALGLVAGPAGYRADQGDGGEPGLRLDQSAQRPSTDPASAPPGIKGSYPNTVNMLLGGGDMPGYQAGSTFKMFTMLAALEHGHAAEHGDLRAAAAGHQLPHRHRHPASCGGLLVPVNASAVDDRRADHVVGLRQVGQHLLGPAGAAGRRGRARSRWPSGSA